MSAGRVLIAGCGFVGLATARVLHGAGSEVRGLTHSEESARVLAAEPFAVFAADLTDREALDAQAAWQPEVVIHCASSGRGGVEQYQRVYLEGVRNLAKIFQPRMLVFTSSTSVYAQTSGEWVTELSVAAPDRETGKVLRETEDLVLARGGAVARLAGIYGPGRSVLLRKFLASEAVLEDGGGRFINQAHRDDIASALALLVSQGASGIFNVADHKPMTQREVYEWLARRFGRLLPPEGPIDPHRKRGWTNKRVSNAKLRALGWAPRYPSFLDAVEREGQSLAADPM